MVSKQELATSFLIIVLVVSGCVGTHSVVSTAAHYAHGADGSAQVIYTNDFNDDPPGIYTIDMLDRDWSNPPWENGVSNGLAEIAEGSDALEGRSLKIRYPAGWYSNGTAWQLIFDQSYDELYLSYWVKFADDFDFVRGGKLPGFAGGTANTGGNVPDGTDGWSARMMWVEDGKMIQYVYHPDQPTQYGQSFRWNYGGYQRFFVPGQWHHLEHRIVMNTPGQRDGLIQGWFDGELALYVRNLRFRDVDTFGIDILYFSTFFGGDDASWAPSKDEYAYFDDFVVSTSRVGHTPTPTPTPNPNELIIDNSDPGFSTSYTQDAWHEYVEANGEHYGDSHHFNAQTGTGTDTATWSFDVLQAGRYNVYAWWWEGSWRPTSVPYTVNHRDGATTVRVNQQVNGGQWNLLGTFGFQDHGAVVVSDDTSSGQDVVADAIKLVYLAPLPLERWIIYLPVVARQ